MGEESEDSLEDKNINRLCTSDRAVLYCTYSPSYYYRFIIVRQYILSTILTEFTFIYQ
mgnify:CR=1 FL=1